MEILHVTFQVESSSDLLVIAPPCRYFTFYRQYEGAEIAQSVRAGRSGDRNPVAERFSAPVQTGPGAHPPSYTMGTGSLPGGIAAGAWH